MVNSVIATFGFLSYIRALLKIVLEKFLIWRDGEEVEKDETNSFREFFSGRYSSYYKISFALMGISVLLYGFNATFYYQGVIEIVFYALDLVKDFLVWFHSITD